MRSFISPIYAKPGEQKGIWQGYCLGTVGVPKGWTLVDGIIPTFSLL